MPTVPKYEGNQIQERQISNGGPVSAQMPAFSNASVAGNTADMAVGLIQKAKQDADQIAVMDADKKLTEIETSLLYDPNNGALNRRGKDAFGLPTQVNEDYTKSAQDIASGLTSDTQRVAFQKIQSERQQSINRTIDKHVGGEIKAYDDAETTSYVETQMQTALTAYRDPDKVQQAVESQKVAIATHAQRNGLPAEWVKLKTEEAGSKTYTNVIQRMVDDGDDIGADKYYQANKDSIVGTDQEKVSKELQIASRLGFAQRTADKILSSKGITATAAYEQARSEEDPKKRQALTEEISRQLTIKKNAEREDEETMQTATKNLLYQNGGNVNDPRVQRVLGRMTINQDNALRVVAKNIQEGRDIITDQQYRRDLMELAVNPETKDKFAKMNLNDPVVYSKLAKGDWDQMFKTQAELRKGKEAKEVKEFRSDSEIANNTLAAMKITKSKSPEKYAMFNDKYYQALIDFKEQNGKRPNEKEMSQIANQLATEVVVGKSFFGLFSNKKKLFEASPDEQNAAFTAQAQDNRSKFASQASVANSNMPARIRDKRTGQILTLNKKTGKYE